MDAPTPLTLPFAQVDPIETTRLRLRPFTLDDRRGFAELQLTEGINKFLYWEVPDDEELDRRLQERISSTLLEIDGDRLCFVVEWKDRPGLIGDVTIMAVSTEHAQLEVGYVIAQHARRLGVATEATDALLELGFSALGAHRMAGRIDARNEASAAVLRRVGMREEAHLIENEVVRGEWTSEKIFAVLEHEWRARRPLG